jgi:hypothetical protein
MKLEDYQGKIGLFFKTNPALTHDELAVILTADLIYKEVPEDLNEFRKKYAHMDPQSLVKSGEGIIFLKIARDKSPSATLKKKLNAYLNVKFNDIRHLRSYKINAKLFKEKSIIASRIIEEILEKAKYPKQIVDTLKEDKAVRECYDFYDMLKLFKTTTDQRRRFEILRKIGLIVLIARINRTVEPEEIENRRREILQAFNRGLGRKKGKRREYYLWLNSKQKVEFCQDREEALQRNRKENILKKRLALPVHPVQRFVCRPFSTYSGNEVLHLEIRNKFGSGINLSFTSYTEKMIRKNLEFPNQIHDTIGIKIVVEDEDRIWDIIRDLESFLGGSSTRKQEKNSYHRFGRHRLSEYSSSEYFVWKAIYDITLPHPSIIQVRKMLKLTHGNPAAREELLNRLKYFISHPKDFVIEVQLQDIKSYLLSNAEGSPTAHDWLKMNQIRSNSFYKFFPEEIYEKEITRLKLGMLSKASI